MSGSPALYAPLPEWLFGWAAAVVLVVSFAALGVLWSRPRLEDDEWRPLPFGFGKVLGSRAVEIVTRSDPGG